MALHIWTPKKDGNPYSGSLYGARPCCDEFSCFCVSIRLNCFSCFIFGVCCLVLSGPAGVLIKIFLFFLSSFTGLGSALDQGGMGLNMGLGVGWNREGMVMRVGWGQRFGGIWVSISSVSVFVSFCLFLSIYLLWLFLGCISVLFPLVGGLAFLYNVIFLFFFSSPGVWSGLLAFVFYSYIVCLGF